MNVGFSFRGMRDVSQGELSWREEELACRSVCELFNDGRELLERKGCAGCEQFRGRETRKVYRNAQTFLTKHSYASWSISYQQPLHWQKRLHHPF